LIGQTALSLTNQSSTTASDLKSPDQNLSPTADQQSTSRIYNTNQSSSGTSDSLGKAASENVNVKIQAATEADRTLGQQVVQELRTDTTLAALLPKIRLNVESGKITLSGTVKSEDQKQKIESAVKRVTGVANVEDHLKVSASSSEDGTTQDNQQENK
jgi:osmotically-inducible protein OsmY